MLAVILVTVGTVVSVFIGYQKVSNVPDLLLDSIKDGANLSLGKIKQTATTTKSSRQNVPVETILIKSATLVPVEN